MSLAFRDCESVPRYYSAALGSTRRLSIIELLASRARRPKELKQLLQISSPGVSRHLRILQQAGIICKATTGYGVFYRLTSKRLAAEVNSHLSSIKQQDTYSLHS